MVALNRAALLAEMQGPLEAIAVLDTLDLKGCYLFHSIRGPISWQGLVVLQRLRSLGAAMGLTTNALERAFLARSRQALD